MKNPEYSLFSSNSEGKKKLFFDVFRYNLVPNIPANAPDTLLFDKRTIEEIKQKAKESKNNFFAELLATLPSLINSQKTKLTFQLKAHNNNIFFFRLGRRKDAILQDRNFHAKREENWEDIFLIFDNDPSGQYIYVQKNTTAFKDTYETIAKLRSIFNQFLKQRNLIVEINAVYRKQAFWDLVNKHKLAIKKVEFQISAPNLPQLSDVLPQELKELAQVTTASNVRLSLESENAGVLSLDQAQDQKLAGLVNYVENGGGSASIYIKNYKKTSLSKEGQITTKSIDSIVLENATDQDIQSVVQLLHE